MWKLVVDMRNVIKRAYSMGLRNFHVEKDNMILSRALQVVPGRPYYSPSHRCYCRVSMPTLTSMAEEMNVPGDSLNCWPDISDSDSDSDSLPLFKGLRGKRGGYYRRRVNPRGGCGPGLLALLDGDLRGSSIGADDIFKSEVITNHINWGTYLGLETKGERLLEVFSVRIIDCENSGYLYGTIEFECCPAIVDLYNQKSSDPEPVSQDGTLSLSGPDDCLVLDDDDNYFGLQLKLKDKDGNLFPDEYASIQWNFKLLRDNDLYNERMIKYFYGNSVSIAVYHMIFRDAVQAKVEVDVVKEDDEDGANQVYGRVVARYSNYEYSTDEQKKYFQTILFNKSKNNYVEVDSGNPKIPLSRYVVAVPTTSFLIIEVNLRGYDKLKKPDDQLARGTLVFPPKTQDVTLNYIHGDNGRVRVTVTWGLTTFLEQW